VPRADHHSLALFGTFVIVSAPAGGGPKVRGGVFPEPLCQAAPSAGPGLAHASRPTSGLVTGSSAPADWPRILVVVDEVGELTVRDLGDDRAARAAQQAATGRPCAITGLGRSGGHHLVGFPQESGCRGGAGAAEGHPRRHCCRLSQRRRQQRHPARQRQRLSAAAAPGPGGLRP
jgi:hypothetical protein